MAPPIRHRSKIIIVIVSHGISNHDSFEIDWILRAFVVMHDFSSELRDVMSGVTLSGDVNLTAVVSRKPVKPFNKKLK